MVFETLQNKERERNSLVSKSFTFYYSILCFPFVISRLHSLLLLLKEKNGSNIDDTEAQYSYCFSDISVGIWRQNIPENFSEYEIKDATEEEKNIWKTEQNKAKFFWTIGIGNVGYYDI